MDFPELKPQRPPPFAISVPGLDYSNDRLGEAVIHDQKVLLAFKPVAKVAGWDIRFYDSADDLLMHPARRPYLFVDNLLDIAKVKASSPRIHLYQEILAIGPDSEEFAEVAEQLGATMVLTFPVNSRP